MTEITTLLKHDSWLRSLAFRLAGPDYADDTLQQAWVEYRTHKTVIQNPAAWFTRVLQNLVARRARDLKTQATHEEFYAEGRSRAALPTVDLVARMELQRRVAEAVIALAEPYRSTVISHFVEGMSTKEIAEHTSEPWATVRSRLSRAIEYLRKDLAGDGRDWQNKLALAVFGVPSTQLRKAPAAAATSAAIALVTILLVTVATPIVLFGFGSDSSDGSLESPSKNLAAASGEPDGREAPMRRQELHLTPLVVADKTLEPRIIIYQGELRDPMGLPLAGVELFLDAEKVGECDQDGRFSIELPEGDYQLETDERHWILCDAPLREGEQNRFLAARCMRLHGKVLNSEDGSPIPGVRLSFRSSTPVDYPFPLTELTFRPGPQTLPIDDEGRFDILVPWVLGSQLSAVANGHGGQGIEFGHGYEFFSFSMTPDEEPRFKTEPQRIYEYRDSVEVQIALWQRAVTSDVNQQTWVIEGVVFDQENRPVEGAQVALGAMSAVRTGGDGRFRIDTGMGGLMDGGHLVAWHPEHGAAVVAEPLERWRLLGNKNPHEDLRLEPATQSLRGRVTDRDGLPVAGRRIRITEPLIAYGHDRVVNTVEEEAFRVGVLSDESGYFELSGLLNRSYRLRVLDESSFFLFESDPIRTGNDGEVIVLPAPTDLQPEWRGSVVDAEGRGLPGVSVTVSLWGPWGSLGSIVMHSTVVETDAEGRVVLLAQSSSSVTITFEAPGRMLEARARSELNSPEIRLGRVVQFQYLPTNPPPSLNQRVLAVLDAQDRQLVIRGPYDGRVSQGMGYYLTDGKSAVLETSEFATTLVIITDDGSSNRQEPHRYPLQLMLGEITVIH